MARLAMTAVAAILVAAQAGPVQTKPPERPDTPKPEPVDRFMGEYVGTYKPADGEAAPAEAKVVPDGGGKYRVVLIRPPVGEGPSKMRIELAGKVEGDRLAFAGQAGKTKWVGRIAGKLLRAEAEGQAGGRFEGKLTVRRSPTEGLKPPKGAVVLLPMTEGPPPLAAWTNRKWKALPGGVMQVTRGGSNTVKSFGDVKLHLEFRLPYEPTKRGQGRGNSGVYLQHRYEIQVLDSFGLVPRQGDCGAIYGVAAPKVNACLPPLRWQTYDVTFLAPRRGEDGKLAKPGRITVLHNGIEIHKDVPLKGTTRAGAPGLVQLGPLHLQDHGHPIQFRNIWVVELTEPAKQ